MNTKFAVRLFYVIYSVYVLLVANVTSIDLRFLMLSVFMMWVHYFVFSMGYSLKPRKTFVTERDTNRNGWLSNRSNSFLLLIGISSLLSATMVVKYYTGQTPLDVLTNIKRNVSVYYQYQTFFRENARDVLSISKLPFMFMMFYTKSLMFYSYMVFFNKGEKTTKFELFYVLLVTLAYLYIGIGRGTMYEFFEMAMIVIFVVFSNEKVKSTKNKIKSLAIMAIIVTIAIYMFYWGLEARGVVFNYNISNDVFYDYGAFIPTRIPFVGFVTLILYSYFGFGFYYMSSYISKVWLSSYGNLIAGLIPYGYVIIGGRTLQEHMKMTVHMGAKWHPDAAKFIHQYGYIGLLLICFFLGFILRKMEFEGQNTPMSKLTRFIVLLQMVSLPVGNFVTVSSSSRLIVLMIAFYWVLEKYKKEKVNLTVKKLSLEVK